MEPDPRYIAVFARIQQLSDSQIDRIIENIDDIILDGHNYLDGKFCPLGVALELDELNCDWNEELVRAAISLHFRPVNVLHGVPGHFYREHRKECLLQVCQDVIRSRHSDLPSQLPEVGDP